MVGPPHIANCLQILATRALHPYRGMINVLVARVSLRQLPAEDRLADLLVWDRR